MGASQSFLKADQPSENIENIFKEVLRDLSLSVVLN